MVEKNLSLKRIFFLRSVGYGILFGFIFSLFFSFFFFFAGVEGSMFFMESINELGLNMDLNQMRLQLVDAFFMVSSFIILFGTIFGGFIASLIVLIYNGLSLIGFRLKFKFIEEERK